MKCLICKTELPAEPRKRRTLAIGSSEGFGFLHLAVVMETDTKAKEFNPAFNPLCNDCELTAMLGATEALHQKSVALFNTQRINGFP